MSFPMFPLEICVMGGKKEFNSAVPGCSKTEVWHPRCKFVSKRKQNLVKYFFKGKLFQN